MEISRACAPNETLDCPPPNSCITVCRLMCAAGIYLGRFFSVTSLSATIELTVHPL